MKPPFTITQSVLNSIAKLERLIGTVESLHQPKPQPKLRKSNRVRTVHGSLAIEGNTLSLEQITALLEGKRVIGEKKEIQEVLNAIHANDMLPKLNPFKTADLLKAHKFMTDGLLTSAGRWRSGNVGIVKNGKVSHVAPQANRVDDLMSNLFKFINDEEVHLLIRSCVFHYELEFIHPFEDGNGRIGRLWQSLMLYHYHPAFEFIPVESFIRDHQEEYYAALEASDEAGDATAFVEFSLRLIHQAFSDFLDELKPAPLTTKSRLRIAHNHFRNLLFSRKDYLKVFKTISSATASRDLTFGVDEKLLNKIGDKSQAKYKFLD